jgi:hypothetical protein
MRKLHRLRLLDLLDLRSSPTVLPSLLSHAVETDQAHHKKIKNIALTITKPINALFPSI